MLTAKENPVDNFKSSPPRSVKSCQTPPGLCTLYKSEHLPGMLFKLAQKIFPQETFSLTPWNLNNLTFIIIWRHFIHIALKKTQAPSFLSEKPATLEILDSLGRFICAFERAVSHILTYPFSKLAVLLFVTTGLLTCDDERGITFS